MPMNLLWVRSSLWLMPFSPLVGAVANGLLGRRLSARAIHWIGCGSVLLAFFVACTGFFALSGIAPPRERVLTQSLYRWIVTSWDTGSFRVAVDLRLDPLSSVLCLVVTGVGFLIHLYSVGYMAGDQGLGRYFAYMNLFTFAMLLLVLADNLLLLFVGWEGVGLCSYLLIGFWFHDLDKARAGMKAFIVNRVGDFGFFVGLMLLFWGLYETSGGAVTGLDYGMLEQSMPRLLAAPAVLGVALPTWVALLLLLGATGKSAQIPLYVWLPDAMAGPTPVSAFIHAATMVTAGVYMTVRLRFLYLAAPWALVVVAVIGGVTACYAATIALVQDDIKKVLAYSTISQLGYLFLAVGVAAFDVAIFHLVTHAFFKALLFLGAGSVIHAVHGNDLKTMGGLRRRLPVTYFTFLVAYLAICGIPPFAGFMSKDAILAAAFNARLPLPGLAAGLWLLALLTAGLTAFYMTRLVVLAFAGSFRGGAELETRLHESPPVMTGPLLVLALLSVLGGLIGLPEATGLPNLLGDFLGSGNGAAAVPIHSGQGVLPELALMACSIAVAGAGIGFGWWCYVRRPELPAVAAARWARIHRLLIHKYYLDEIYQALLVRPLLRLTAASGRFDLERIDAAVNGCSRLTARLSRRVGWGDLRLVDGAVNAVAAILDRLAAGLSRIQSGRVQHYLYSVAAGLFILMLIEEAVRQLAIFG